MEGALEHPISISGFQIEMNRFDIVLQYQM